MNDCSIVPIVVLALSLIIALVLDINKLIKAASFYWTFGTINGIIIGSLIALCLGGLK